MSQDDRPPATSLRIDTASIRPSLNPGGWVGVDAPIHTLGWAGTGVWSTDDVPPRGLAWGEDPFAIFAEWTSTEDEAAFRNLRGA